MPVIRVDDQVWKELQKRAVPLVDTPNSVLRRLLVLNNTTKNDTDEYPDNILEITLNHPETSRKFALIQLPKDKRKFFPGFKVYFSLETDIGTVETRVTSAPKGTPVGDPLAGAYIQGNLRHWFEQHSDLETGDKVRFEVIEPGKRYKLSVRQS